MWISKNTNNKLLTTVVFSYNILIILNYFIFPDILIQPGKDPAFNADISRWKINTESSSVDMSRMFRQSDAVSVVICPGETNVLRKKLK